MVFKKGAHNPRLSAAISIKTPTAFKSSIFKVKRLKGISPAKKKRALTLARTRAQLHLKRKNLSPRERKQMGRIAKTRLPPVRAFS